MLALIHYQEKNWFIVDLAWVYNHNGYFINKDVKPTNVTKASMYILDGLYVHSKTIEHFFCKNSFSFFVFLDEWKIMWNYLLEDHKKNGLNLDSLYSLSRIIKQIYNIDLKY